jgi:hypothetical protein
LPFLYCYVVCLSGCIRFLFALVVVLLLFVCCFMVFNATFNNISVISWWSALLMEETKVPRKTTDLSQVTDKLDMKLIMKIVL